MPDFKRKGHPMKHEITSQNTKRMLVDTFLELLHKKPLSKITVSEIVNTCHINRKTFYYHFTDIYDLLEWYLNEKVNETLGAFDLVNDFEKILQLSQEYIEKNPFLANCADDPVGSEKLVHFFSVRTLPFLLEILSRFEQENNKQLDENYKYFLADLFAKSSSLSLVEMLKGKNSIDYKQYGVYLSDTFRGALEGILIKMGK